MAKIDRVESYKNGEVVVSFKSEVSSRQMTMLKCSGAKARVVDGQPDFYLYSKEERMFMKKATLAIYRIIYPYRQL